MRWIRATLSLLIGAALVLLGAALLDHHNEADLTSLAAIAVGFFCVIRGLVLFWTH